MKNRQQPVKPQLILPMTTLGQRSGSADMITLTRLNNQAIAVNSDLIKFVEKSPDTVITLINGEKIIVREPVDLVLERIIHFRRSISSHPETASPPKE
jgi:flagellar protein FlbD